VFELDLGVFKKLVLQQPIFNKLNKSEKINYITYLRSIGLSDAKIGKYFHKDAATFCKDVKALGIPRSSFVPPKLKGELDDPEFDRMLKYISSAQKKGVKLTPRDYNEFLKNTSADKRFVPYYRRPEVFSEKQNYVVERIVNSEKKIIMVEGDQRTGKSTAVFCALHELVLKFEKPIKIDLMAGKGGSGDTGGATRILNDLFRDMLLQEVNNQMISYKTNRFIQYFNGSKLIAHETTVADIKGSDSEVTVCEEMDVAIKNSPEAVMSLLLTLRARKDLKIILVANMDTGVYRLIRTVLSDPKWSDDVEFITMTNEDAPWIADAGNDPLLMEISDAIVGEEFTQRRFMNIDLGEGEMFDPHAMMDALETYDQALIDIGLYKELDDGGKVQIASPLRVVIGVDPGHDHPCGVFIGAVYREHIYEIASFKRIGVSADMPKGRFGKVVRMKQEDLIEKVAMIAQEYHATIFCESNSGGKEWIDAWNSYPNVHAYPSNFGGKGQKNDEFLFIKKLAMLIESGRFHFKSKALYKEATIYDPRVNKNDRKGNLVDACLHCVWHLLRLSRKKGKKTFSQYNRG